MKDLAHHMKKLNRRVIRSSHREELQEELWDQSPPALPVRAPSTPLAQPKTVRQVKKQAKTKVAKARKARPATPLTPEQKNRKMKKRVPVFDRKNKATPKKGARKTAKKTPRI